MEGYPYSKLSMVFTCQDISTRKQGLRRYMAKHLCVAPIRMIPPIFGHLCPVTSMLFTNSFIIILLFRIFRTSLGLGKVRKRGHTLPFMPTLPPTLSKTLHNLHTPAPETHVSQAKNNLNLRHTKPKTKRTLSICKP